MRRGLFRVAVLGLAALAVGCTSQSFDIDVAEVLEVTSIAPHNGAIDVPLTVTIAAEFSHPVAALSLSQDSGGVELLEGVEGSRPERLGFSAQLDTATGTKLTVTPDEPLEYGRTYTLRLTPFIENQARTGFLAATVVSVFTTEGAPEAFEVATTWPADGQGDVPLADSDGIPTRPIMAFNHRVDEMVTLDEHFRVIDLAGDNVVPGSWTLDPLGQRVTFTPDLEWTYSQAVSITALQGLPDVDGKTLAEDVGFSFTFAEQTPLPFRVLSTDPPDGQQDVARLVWEGEDPYAREIAVYFSDAIDDGWDWPGSFSVRNPDTSQPVSGAWWLEEDGTRAVFAPSTMWDFAQPVEVTVAEGLRGVGLGELEADYVFGFTFESAPPFWVVSTFPTDGMEDVQPVDPASMPTALEIYFNSEPADVIDWETHFEVHDITVPGNEVDVGPMGSWSIDKDNSSTVFRLTTGESWSYSQSVRVNLAAGLQSVWGGTLAADHEFSFTFTSPTELVVVRTDPPDGAQRIPIADPGGGETQVEVFFNEPLSTSQSWETHLAVEEILPVGPVAVTGTWELGAGNRSVAFSPDLAWRYGEVVRVTVASGLIGLSGSELASDCIFSFVLEEPPPLAVVSIEPANGAERVPREDGGAPTEIRIVFSEGVEQTSASLTTGTVDGAITITDVASGDPVLGSLFFEMPEPTMDDDTAIFRATLPWAYSQEVQVNVGYTVESDRGSPLGEGVADDVGSSFLFEDPPALLLLSRHPAPQAPDVLIGTDLSWQFSRPLDPTSVNPLSLRVWLDSDSLETNLCTEADGTLTLDLPGTTVTCNPTDSFPEGERVNVALAAGPGGIKADDATLRGGWLDEQTADLIYSFDVKAAPELGIVAAFPSIDPDGQPARNVDPQTSVRVIFDRAVDPSTVDDASFIVRRCATDGPCPDSAFGTDLPASKTCAPGDNCIAFAQGDTEVIWTHATHFEYETYFTVVVGEAVTSADGQARMPDGGYTYSFHVAPPPTMSVVSTRPTDGSVDLTRRPEITIDYDMDIDGASLLVDPFEGDGLLPNVFINRGAATDWDTALIQGADYDVVLEDSDTVRVNLLRNLDLGQTYTVTSTMDLRNVEGGGLAAQHDFQFAIRAGGLLESLSPADGTVDVPVVGTVIEAVFREDMDESTIGVNTFGLIFTDRFGRLHSVPGAVAYDAGTRTATFTPSETGVGHCHGGAWPLIYGSEYEVRLSPRIASLAGETLGPEPASFTTVAAPGVSAIYSEGVVLGYSGDDRAVLDGSVDVPQNSKLFVEFGEPMSSESFVVSGTPQPTDTVVLEQYPPPGQPQIPTRFPVSVSYSDLPRPILEVTPSGHLVSQMRYVLRIKGKDLGNTTWVTTAAGQPLADTITPSFYVASDLTAKLSLAICPDCCHSRCRWSGDPPEWSCPGCDCPVLCRPEDPIPPDPGEKSLLSETPFQDGVISVAFNRPVVKASVEAGFSITINTFPWLCNYNYPQVIGANTAQSVSCEPQAGGISATNEVRAIVTEEVMDENGNPLRTPIDQVLEAAESSPGSTVGPLVIPGGANLAGSETVVGDQEFLAAWPLHALVLRLKSDLDPNPDPDVHEPPVGPAEGDAYIAHDWGSGFTDGHLYEWDGSEWIDILGRDVNYGDWVIVDANPQAGSSFEGKANQLLYYFGWALHYHDDWGLEPGDTWWTAPFGPTRLGWRAVINGEGGFDGYEGESFEYKINGDPPPAIHWEALPSGTFAWPRDRIDPATVHGGSVIDDPAGASIALFDLDAGNDFVPVYTEFVPIKPDGFDYPDWVKFWPIHPLTHGHRYEIQVRGTTMIKNLAGNVLSSDTSAYVDVEDFAPQVDEMGVRYWDDVEAKWVWQSIMSGSLNDVPADSPVKIFFSEKVDRASVQAEISLEQSGVGPIPVTIEQQDGSFDSTVLVIPDAPLLAGATYDVMIDGALADITGKAMGPTLVRDFTVDAAAATIPRTSPVGVNTALDAQVTVWFSQPMDPLTFKSGDLGLPGDAPATLWLEHVAEADGPNPCGTLTTPFCISFSAELREVYLTPLGPGLQPHRKYNVIFDTTEIMDLGGTLLDPAYGPLEFETVPGPPLLLCTIPDKDTLITREDPIDLHFSEPVDLASLEDHARLVNINTGLQANLDVIELAEAGSYRITPAVGEPLDAATIYWLEASDSVLDTALLDGLNPQYYAKFTTHGMVINEVLFDPPGIAADVNCDGEADHDNDEFVELVNIGTDPVEISGWTLESASLGTLHTFAGGTTIPSRGVMLVFGGGVPGAACFPGASLVTADSGLALLVTDTLWLRDAAGLVIDVTQWDSPAGIDQSIVRDPDGTGEFRAHSGAAGSEGAAYSPGTRTDGTAH